MGEERWSLEEEELSSDGLYNQHSCRRGNATWVSDDMYLELKSKHRKRRNDMGLLSAQVAIRYVISSSIALQRKTFPVLSRNRLSIDPVLFF